MAQNKKIVWILGAGADIASGIPTVNLFLPVAYYVSSKDSGPGHSPILEELISDKIEKYLSETRRFSNFLPSLDQLMRLYDLTGYFEDFIKPCITKMYNYSTEEIPFSIYQEWKPPARYYWSEGFGVSQDKFESSIHSGPLWVRGMLKSSFRKLFYSIGEQFVHGTEGPWNSSEGYSILTNVLGCFPNIEDLLNAAHVVNKTLGRRESTDETITKNYHYFLTASLIQLIMYENFKGRNKDVKEIRNNAEDIIRILLLDTFFSLQFREHTRGPYPVLANILKPFRDTVINFNYTFFLEALLRDKYSYLIEGKQNQKAIPLIKLHGSLGWYKCISCLRKKFLKLDEIRCSLNPLDFSIMCDNCRLCLMQPLIIPPTAFKFMDDPDLFLLWNTAFEKISESEIIIALGLSFSPTDIHFVNFFKTAIEQKSQKKLFIIDPYDTAINNLQQLNIIGKLEVIHIKERAENILKNVKWNKIKELSTDTTWGELVTMLFPMD